MFYTVPCFLSLLSLALGYDHVNRKDYRVVLTNGYEDGIVGVHLKNKKQQDRAMNQFVAGHLAAGEMGCGIELHDVNPYVKKIKDDMYQGQGFDEYISEHLGRSSSESETVVSGIFLFSESQQEPA